MIWHSEVFDGFDWLRFTGSVHPDKELFRVDSLSFGNFLDDVELLQRAQFLL